MKAMEVVCKLYLHFIHYFLLVVKIWILLRQRTECTHTLGYNSPNQFEMQTGLLESAA